MKKRYITNGVRLRIPVWLQNLIWFLWESAEVSEQDCCQVFELCRSESDQKVIQSQKNPPYRRVVEVSAVHDIAEGKILIVEEFNQAVMLLASEYEGGF